MSRITWFAAAALAAAFASGGTAAAQAASPTPHTISVKLDDEGGGKYAFVPAKFTAERGDTLRFVNGSDMVHNVHFTSAPKGSKLGGAAMGPFLSTKGQVYTVIVDSRFTAGAYTLVCDPHDLIGMHATLTVVDGKTQTAAQ